MTTRFVLAWAWKLTRPSWPTGTVTAGLATAARVTTTAFALIAMVEGAAALASADPATYPPRAQRSMLATTLTAFGL